MVHFDVMWAAACHHLQHLGLLQVLLLDEPLAGLDWQMRAEVATTLAELKRRCTVLVVSHDLRELVPLVSRSQQFSGPSHQHAARTVRCTAHSLHSL